MCVYVSMLMYLQMYVHEFGVMYYKNTCTYVCTYVRMCVTLSHIQ